jgi:RNA polymerase sigma-70 factor (ECF subfamily)
MDEIGAVQAAQRGDSNRYTMLVRSHERSLHATAAAILGAGPDAADAVQDTLITAWRKLPGLRNPAVFGAWLSKILVNRCRQTLRTRSWQITSPDPASLVDPGTYDVLGAEAALDLFAAIRDLEPPHREVIALRYYRDMTIDQIAKTLGCPAGTVKSRINRALAKLGSAKRTKRRSLDELQIRRGLP